jgi:hypothetical protein
VLGEQTFRDAKMHFEVKSAELFARVMIRKSFYTREGKQRDANSLHLANTQYQIRKFTMWLTRENARDLSALFGGCKMKI